jgi:hypothetical protein
LFTLNKLFIDQTKRQKVMIVGSNRKKSNKANKKRVKNGLFVQFPGHDAVAVTAAVRLTLKKGKKKKRGGIGIGEQRLSI